MNQQISRNDRHKESRDAQVRRKSAPLDFRIFKGEDLDDERIRSLWNFRRRFVKNKPHVEDSVDFARFQSGLRRSKAVVVGADACGTPHVLLVLVVCDDAERRERILNWEYAFFSPEHRGEARIYVIWWWLIARNVLEVRGWSVWCAAWTYPASYFVLRGNMPGLVSLQSPGLSPNARDALLRFGRDITDGAFDTSTGVRNMPTIPLEAIDDRPNRALMKEAHREYITANPRWAEGYTLAVVAPVSAISLGSIALTVARRSLRTLRKAKTKKNHTRKD